MAFSWASGRANIHFSSNYANFESIWIHALLINVCGSIFSGFMRLWGVCFSHPNFHWTLCKQIKCKPSTILQCDQKIVLSVYIFNVSVQIPILKFLVCPNNSFFLHFPFQHYKIYFGPHINLSIYNFFIEFCYHTVVSVRSTLTII